VICAASTIVINGTIDRFVKVGDPLAADRSVRTRASISLRDQVMRESGHARKEIRGHCKLCWMNQIIHYACLSLLCEHFAVI